MTTVVSKDDIVFSTQGRAGTPDGNVFLNVADPDNPLIEILSATEVAQIDYGSGLEANRIVDAGGALGGVTARALYGAFGEHRAANEVIRQYRKMAEGRFRFAGAYDLVNNWQLSTSADIGLIRSSGIRYLDVSNNVSRIYFGPKSLGTIDSDSITGYQTSQGGPFTPFNELGPIDELVQVFGTTAFGDAGAGDFDNRAYFAVSVRKFGNISDRKTLADSGFESADFFSGGFGLTESVHPTTGSYDETAINAAAVAPWDTVDYATEAAPVTQTGFNQVDGDFSETIANPSGASLDEIVAYMDALSRRATDIDSGTPVQIGEQVDVLYTFDAQGNVVLKQGLFIENLPGADQTRVILTDDAGDQKTFPTSITVRSAFSAPALADPNSWYHAFIEDDTDGDDFNTATAITAQNKDAVEQKGLVSAVAGGILNFDVNYSAPPPGTNIAASTPYQIRIEVGGDPDFVGGPVENFSIGTIDGASPIVNINVDNAVEQNV